MGWAEAKAKDQRDMVPVLMLHSGQPEGEVIKKKKKSLPLRRLLHMFSSTSFMILGLTFSLFFQLLFVCSVR